jgi:hypothetical protein
MTKLIYHPGTGTYFGMDDSIVVIDLDKHRTEIDIYDLDNEMNYRGAEIAEKCGEPLNVTDSDLNWSNVMSFSPSSIIEEAKDRLDSQAFHGEDDKRMLEWVLDSATSGHLADIATIALQHDDLWESWAIYLWDSVREIWTEATGG